MKRTTKKLGKKGPSVTMLRSDDQAGLAAYFAEQGQLLLPMLELLETGRQTIASAMNEAGRGMAELLLMLSAQLESPESSSRDATTARCAGTAIKTDRFACSRESLR